MRFILGNRRRAGGIGSVAAGLALLLSTAPALAAGRHATLVVDGNTGAVLSEAAADEPRYPASLTKMMTLYVVFELIEQGRLSYATRIRVSEAAASTQPSKLGVNTGSDIALIDAIKSLVTKSANDMAVAIAEHIAGSEDKFAALMTQRARHIGMKSSTFRNANGLPDNSQVTTARDMVTLGLRLQDDFPRHYPLFATREFHYGGESHRNHNTLLYHYEGTDGIKTGYISASGYNLVANVRRGGKHVIGVVFGGASGGARNQTMRTLLNSGLARASTARTRQTVPIARARPVPEPRPAPRPEIAQRPEPLPRTAPTPRLAQAPAAGDAAQDAARAVPALRVHAPAAAADTTTAAVDPVPLARVRPILVAPRQPRQAPTPPVEIAEAALPAIPPEPIRLPLTPPAAPHRSAMPPPAPPFRQPASATATPTRGAAPSTFQQQAQNLARSGDALVATPAPPEAPVIARTQFAEASSGAPPSRLNGPVTGPGGVHIQIGAFSTAAEAERQLAAVRAKATDLLGTTQGVAIAVQANGRQLFRARYAGFDAAKATSVCTELRRRQIDCMVAKAD